MGCRIPGRWNFFLGLEKAHGFDGGLIVYAGHFAGIEAALFERLLNLERARLIDFEALALSEKVRISVCRVLRFLKTRGRRIFISRHLYRRIGPVFENLYLVRRYRVVVRDDRHVTISRDFMRSALAAPGGRSFG